MSMVEYKIWKVVAFLGLIVWMVMPFANIKLFGVSLIGFFALLFSIGLIYPIIKKFFATIRLSYIVGVAVTIAFAQYWNVADLGVTVIASIMMMSLFIFAMACMEMSPTDSE